MRNNQIIQIIALSFVVVGFVGPIQICLASDWTMFHENSQHTGVSESYGPIQGEEL